MFYEDFSGSHAPTQPVFSVVQQNSNLKANEIECVKSFQTVVTNNDLTKKLYNSVDNKKTVGGRGAAKRKSADVNTPDDSKKQKSNQKEAAQRYRQNLKDKSQKVSDELQVECERNEKLKTMLNSLESAIGTLSKSLISHTRIDNVDNLLDALKSNGLSFAAEKIASNIPAKPVRKVNKADLQVEAPKKTVPVEQQPDVEIIEIKSVKPVRPVHVHNPVYQPIIFKQVSISDDEDCTVNRFQELFLYEDEVKSMPVAENKVDDCIDDVLSTTDFENFSVENFDELLSSVLVE